MSITRSTRGQMGWADRNFDAYVGILCLLFAAALYADRTLVGTGIIGGVGAVAIARRIGRGVRGRWF